MGIKLNWLPRRIQLSLNLDYILNNNELSDSLRKELIIKTFEQYEKVNLKKIEELHRDRVITERKISGALRDTFNVHPKFNRDLIGSATKRIYGAIAMPKAKEKKKLRIILEYLNLI